MNSERDQQLCQRRMRIEKGLIADVMLCLADEKHFVEHDPVRMTDVPEADGSCNCD